MTTFSYIYSYIFIFTVVLLGTFLFISNFLAGEKHMALKIAWSQARDSGRNIHREVLVQKQSCQKVVGDAKAQDFCMRG